MKRKELCFIILCIFLFMSAILCRTEIAEAIIAAGTRCVLVIIPSLYLFSVLAAFCIRTGILEALSAPLNGFCRKFLRTDGIFVVILLFSQLAGYPVGAQLLQQMRVKHDLPPALMRRLLCCCFGCGPAFLFGMCSGFPRRLAALLMLSVILPNVLLGLFLIRGGRMHTAANISADSTDLTAAVESAAAAMLKISSMILLFAALSGMLGGFACLRRAGEFAAELSGCPSALVQSGCAAVMEISSLTEFLRQGGSLPAAAALLSFGGICVHLQNAAICGGEFPWRKFLLVRICCAFCTYWLCRAGLWLSGDAVSPVFCEFHPYSTALTENSVLPLLCLLVMVLLLLDRLSQTAGVGRMKKNVKKSSLFTNKSLTNDGK